MPKPNYRHAKKQKEESRKARKLEKQQRRAARSNGSAEAPAQDQPAGQSDATVSSGT